MILLLALILAPWRPPPLPPATPLLPRLAPQEIGRFHKPFRMDARPAGRLRWAWQ